jgi:hypothetical protein
MDNVMSFIIGLIVGEIVTILAIMFCWFKKERNN